MKYRKLPVVIEAEQWFPGKHVDGVILPDPGADVPENPFQGRALVHTLEGAMIVSPGDYIITGVAGEKYPCKPEIFEQTYEEVEE